MFKVSAHYVTTGTKMVSPFVDSSVNDVLLQNNTVFTNHFLNSLTFLQVIWWTRCCMTAKQCNWLDFRGHRFEDIKFIEFFFISQGDHLSGKTGNVREFETCQGNVREKILSGKSVPKLFITGWIFAFNSIFFCSLCLQNCTSIVLNLRCQ